MVTVTVELSPLTVEGVTDWGCTALRLPVETLASSSPFWTTSSWAVSPVTSVSVSSVRRETAPLAVRASPTSWEALALSARAMTCWICSEASEVSESLTM